MGQGWKQVWAQRRVDETLASELLQLMALDGLDSGFGELSEEAWREYLAHVGWRMGVCQYSSVYEVGCGAGAFLYEWYRWGCRIGGLDASPALVAIARRFMPRADLRVADAADLDVQQRYEFVVSSAVFRYFPSQDYARGVLEHMARKAERGVAVLDVPDKAREQDALEMRRRRLGAARYDERYRGLPHLHFERSWFSEPLERAGFKRVLSSDQAIRGYVHAPYRFNVFAFRS
jgi:trans-aconitate methyltransferase